MCAPWGCGGVPTAPPRARTNRIPFRLGLLVCALVIVSGPRAALGVVPSPTPRPSSADDTPTATPTPTPPCDAPAPVLQAAPDTVRSGELVTLTGSASTGTITATRWSQAAGPWVTIATADPLHASFVAPPVAASTVVTITLSLISPCTPPILSTRVDVTVLPPPGTASIAVEDASVVVGIPGAIDVTLHSDVPVASGAHDLTLGRGLAFAATSEGRPQCAPSAELGGAEIQFEFTPPDCISDACTGIHVAFDAADPIPDGALLYTCAVADAGLSPARCDYPYDCCDHLLACDHASAAGADGAAVPVQCVEGVVGIRYPQPAAEFVFTIDPPEPRVGDVVHLTVETVRRSPGLIGMPVYSIVGTTPFFIGDISPRRSTGPTRVIYELQVAQAGTAEISIGMTFETLDGCPGNDFYPSDGLVSQVFPITIAAAACAGDCDADGRVAVAELVTGVRMALGDAAPSACPAMDGNRHSGVQVDDLVAAVNYALNGCPPP